MTTQENTHSISAIVTQPIDATQKRLTELLAEAQMGIVSTVDVQATLKNKLDIDSHPQRLLGICSPKLAHQILEADASIGALLPCSCYLTETVAGQTTVYMQNPLPIKTHSSAAPVHESVEMAYEALRNVIAKM